MEYTLIAVGVTLALLIVVGCGYVQCKRHCKRTSQIVPRFDTVAVDDDQNNTKIMSIHWNNDIIHDVTIATESMSSMLDTLEMECDVQGSTTLKENAKNNDLTMEEIVNQFEQRMAFAVDRVEYYKTQWYAAQEHVKQLQEDIESDTCYVMALNRFDAKLTNKKYLQCCHGNKY